MIAVQTHDFDPQQQWAALSAAAGVGAVVTFVGLVRDFSPTQSTLTIEHYPGMTEKTLQQLEQQARQRWPLLDVRIIHRVGELTAGEQIVFVGTCSAHRKAAFAACEYLIDVLKTTAPFWKKEGDQWVEAKTADLQRSADWQKDQ